ncbi:MAG: (deoxy)nucleoside triphosphate pyrophosphohydrolase [Maledivibacter sp.]|nr:(deoxy)nucleoside triphosphate pyrophosphohydrolase [Maledivibacter sp.]
MPIIVLAGIIRYRNKILIAKRFVKELNMYKWEFPGGKLEKDEGLVGCLKREIKEELNLDITVGEIFEVVYYRYSEKDVVILAYLCNSNTYNAQAIECCEYHWIEYEELNRYDFLEADKAIVKKLYRYKENIYELQ